MWFGIWLLYSSIDFEHFTLTSLKIFRQAFLHFLHIHTGRPLYSFVIKIILSIKRAELLLVFFCLDKNGEQNMFSTFEEFFYVL